MKTSYQIRRRITELIDKNKELMPKCIVEGNMGAGLKNLDEAVIRVSISHVLESILTYIDDQDLLLSNDLAEIEYWDDQNYSQLGDDYDDEYLGDDSDRRL